MMVENKENKKANRKPPHYSPLPRPGGANSSS